MAVDALASLQTGERTLLLYFEQTKMFQSLSK